MTVVVAGDALTPVSRVVVTPGVIVVLVVEVALVEVVLVVEVVALVVLVVLVVLVGLVLVVVDVAREHVGTVTTLSSMVTAPPNAKARPLTVAPVFSVIDVVARIEPAKFVVVPKVAELPTCQNTLHAWAPFSRATVLEVAVVNVDAAWKMKTESASPAPLSVTVPVRAMDEVDR
jgi:hypothetical protein